ncbi:F-box domain-containing protein [Phlyctema vagabunda]|uniref:F-box domain-containing protein n=1 Tax=Phlyctema vagabunda TaxID=108571 RepID=A0ABR4PRK4_9HELO
MASSAQGAMVEASSRVDNDGIERSPAIAIDGPKLKGRAKFLHRISSSPTLLQLSRKRASSNPYTRGTTANSSNSLALGGSPSSRDNSYSSQLSNGISTAPTTPGLDTPFFDGRSPLRKMDNGSTGCVAASSPLSQTVHPFPELVEDYFSLPLQEQRRAQRLNFNFWAEMPHELRLAIFSFLTPKQLVRASIVSKEFYKACFDGQLWTSFDASEFYRDISAEALSKIIVAAGPFIKDLNLRGCVQVEHYNRAEIVVKACRNLLNATLEGCKNFHRSTLHSLLTTNERLTHLNLTGLTAVTNGTCKIIAQSCPQLEMFNVSWCTHMDVRGIKMVLKGCPKLKDLRAGEIKGFHKESIARAIFETINLERLVLSGCTDITDEALKIMLFGEITPELDALTDIPIVAPRRWRHLDLTRCHRLRSDGISSLAHMVPHLQGLNLSGLVDLDESGIAAVVATTPYLTHLDLEEISHLTNDFLSRYLARAPCAPILRQLSVSYCEEIGDVGMLPVFRACTSLEHVEMDNTKISDLVLVEAASMVRARSASQIKSRPKLGLQLVVFDCQNVTWTGVREVLSRNAEVSKPNTSPSYPTEVIQLKCFYGWMPTVVEHMKRVMKGDLAAAGRLERKWVEYMMANEEAGAAGAGVRRRRRRAREAQMLHADEEEGGIGMGGIGRRRRARSGCTVM